MHTGIPTSSMYDDYRFKVGLPTQLFDGNKAMTVQSFIELNCKLGNQYQLGFYNPSIAPNGSAYLAMEVGASNHVLIKSIYSQFRSQLIASTLFKSPALSAGAGLVLPHFNMRDFGTTNGDVVIKYIQEADVISEGVQVGATNYALGDDSNKPSPGATGVGLLQDIERVLEKGNTYLYRIQNLDQSNATALTGTATWYQGELSIDTPIGDI